MNVTGDPKQPEREEVFLNPQHRRTQGLHGGRGRLPELPGLYQNIRRSQTIKVQAYNLKGELVEKVVSDLEARAWQHEIDHLNGVLFIDMMGPLARLASQLVGQEIREAFREAQEKGEIPPDVEIEKLLAAMETRS